MFYTGRETGQAESGAAEPGPRSCPVQNAAQGGGETGQPSREAPYAERAGRGGGAGLPA